MSNHPSGHPSFSVICTVLNDTDGLRVVLDSLAAQTLPPDEIVVVDGGSRSPERAELSVLAKCRPCVRVIDAPGANIARGRNVAIREARHDLIACIDAGCRANPNWLESLTRPFANPAVDVVGGFYHVAPSSRFQRIVGHLTTPGALDDVDPARFNPSARSLAFRRSAWQRAGGFPEWLRTAEDTLFDLKLRVLDPPIGYAFAEDAVVEWTPRSTWRATFRQFVAYARGEAHIGREARDLRYQGLRMANVAAWTCAAALCAMAGWWTCAGAALLIVTAVVIRPHVRSLVRISMRRPCAPSTASSQGGECDPRSTVHAPRGFFSRWIDAVMGLAVAEWIACARWLGALIGRCERRRRPELYERSLAQYLDGRAADPTSAVGAEALSDVPPWRLIDAKPIPPRTLVVSWHWPPANRASANVLGHLFTHASPRRFRVLTRTVADGDANAPTPPLPTDRVRWPLPDDRPVRVRTFLADVTTMAQALALAWRTHLEWDVQCVLAVFPTRYSLLTGWLIARMLRVPLVSYMHDLFRETLLSGSRVKRAWWSWLDDRILRYSRVILVPTPNAARHYAARGLRRTFVLPHTMPTRSMGRATHEPAVTSDDRPSAAAPGRLKLVYAGAIYEPHEDAVAALIAALRHEPDVSLTFFTKPSPMLAGLDVRWLSPEELAAALRGADACVVALGWNTPYPDEIRVCFPSKIIDYLAAGQPLLAIVPRGCFVDAMIRENGCGVVVNSRDVRAIQEAAAMLRQPAFRARCRAAARELASSFDAADWMSRLEACLAGAGRSRRDGRGASGSGELDATTVVGPSAAVSGASTDATPPTVEPQTVPRARITAQAASRRID